MQVPTHGRHLRDIAVVPAAGRLPRMPDSMRSAGRWPAPHDAGISWGAGQRPALPGGCTAQPPMGWLHP